MSLKMSLKKVAERRVWLLNAIQADSSLTREALANAASVDVKTISRDLTELRKEYDIDWIGPSKGGHWEVKEK